MKNSCLRFVYRNLYVVWGIVVVGLVTVITGSMVASVMGVATGLAITSVMSKLIH